MKPAVVLLSGRVDSATTLAIARNQGFLPYALSLPMVNGTAVSWNRRHAWPRPSAPRSRQSSTSSWTSTRREGRAGRRCCTCRSAASETSRASSAAPSRPARRKKSSGERRSREACDGGCATAMKLLGSILALLVTLVVLAAVPLIARRTQPRSACTGRVVVVIGRHGEPVECTCVHGRLSTCFDPGP